MWPAAFWMLESLQVAWSIVGKCTAADGSSGCCGLVQGVVDWRPFSCACAVSACGSDVKFPYVWCVLVRFPNGKLYWFELKPDVHLAVDGLSHLGPFILEVKDEKPLAVAAAADRWVHRTFACSFQV